MQQETTPPLSGVVVLVVEDKPDVLEATAYLIEAAFGCSVLTASSCVEALALIDEGRHIDLIFSDVILPGKDGLTLARLARERLPHVPVALVTGWEDEVDSITNRGFVALLKPYSVEQLQSIFADLLSAPRECDEVTLRNCDEPAGFISSPQSVRSGTWHANRK